MALYRLLRGLSFGSRTVPAGSIKRLGLDEETVAKLEAVGAVARVSSPPLAEIPLWEERAEKLLQIGVVDAEQLVEADGGRLAEFMGVGPETVKGWKAEAVRWLKPAAPGEDG